MGNGCLLQHRHAYLLPFGRRHMEPTEKEIATKGDADSFECELKEWKAIEKDDIAEVTAEQYTTLMEDMIRELKHEFTKESTDKIEKLTDDTMVISYTDEETGEEMETEHVRVK